MGEAKRREIKAALDRGIPKDIPHLNEHLMKMYNAAGTGDEPRLWRLDIVHVCTVPDLFKSVNPRDVEMAWSCSYVVKQANSAPVLCLLCEHEFLAAGDLPAVVVMLSVEHDKHGVGNGVCADCAEKPDLNGRISDFYRCEVFHGDFRAIDINESVGHA